MLATLGARVQRLTGGPAPWTNVYGLARSILATSSALTLLVNRTDTLFRPVYSMGNAPFCGHGLQKVALYCVGADHLSLVKLIAIAGFLLVASGWRPRVTGLVHWWLSHSYFVTAASIDGGDQATAVLTLLLLPLTLTDPRRWHWQTCEEQANGGWQAAGRVIAFAALLMVRLQVAGIYFHAALGKVFVNEWENGTALYYWLQHPYFGFEPAVRGVIGPLLENRYFVSGLTWGVLALEFFLTMGLIATRGARRVLLLLGVTLHFGIMLCHGLASFTFVMWAALIMLLRPVDEPFSFGVSRSGLARWALQLGRRRAREAAPGPRVTAPAARPTS